MQNHRLRSSLFLGCCLLAGLLLQGCSDDDPTGDVNYHYHSVYINGFLSFRYTYTEDGKVNSISLGDEPTGFNFYYNPDGTLDSIGGPSDWWRKYYYGLDGVLDSTVGNQAVPNHTMVYVFEDDRVKEVYSYSGTLEMKSSYAYGEDSFVKIDSVYDVVEGELYFYSSSRYGFRTDLELTCAPQRTFVSDEALTYLPSNWVKVYETNVHNSGEYGTYIISYTSDSFGRVTKQKFLSFGEYAFDSESVFEY